MKEIEEAVRHYRFLITVILCLVLVPLGMFMALQDYKSRLEGYHFNMEV
jgi:predicted transporter